MIEKENNVILAFLSRSYHESVKNNDAFVLTQTGEENQIDFCWGVPHENLHNCYSTTIINGSDKQAFIAGYREGVKLSKPVWGIGPRITKHSTWDEDRASWINLPAVQRIEHSDKDGNVVEVEYVERGPRYAEFKKTIGVLLILDSDMFEFSQCWPKQ